MRGTKVFGVMIAWMVVLVCGIAHGAKATPHQKPEYVLDLAGRSYAGLRIPGPIVLRLTNVNRLRYEITVGSDVVYAPGPDVSLGFIPPVNRPDRVPNLSDPGKASVSSQMNGVNEASSPVDLDGLRGQIESIVDNTQLVLQDVQALVASSDELMAQGENGPTNVSTQCKGLLPRVEDALQKGRSWPFADIAAAKRERLNVRARFLTALSKGGDAELNRQVVDVLNAQLDWLESVSRSSELYLAWRDQHERLLRWQGILKSVSDTTTRPFETRLEVGASQLSNEHEETTIHLIRRDRLASPTTPASDQVLARIVEPSRFLITSGVGASDFREQEFGVADYGDGPKIRRTKNSKFTLLPLIAVHVRLFELNPLPWQGAVVGFHFTTAAAVDLRSGKTNDELVWIVGGSVSVARQVFVTLARAYGKETHLAEGLAEGQSAPASGVVTLRDGTAKALFAVTYRP